MSNKIRQSDSVKEVSLFGNEVKLSQFSDDTTLICANTKSVESAVQIPTDFGRISGQDFLIGLVHRRYHRPTGGAALAVGLEKGELFKKYSQNSVNPWFLIHALVEEAIICIKDPFQITSVSLQLRT